MEYDVLVVGNVANMQGVHVDKGVYVSDGGGVKGHGAVIDDVSVEATVLEGGKGAGEDGVGVCEDGEERPAGIAESIGQEELRAGGGEGARAEGVEGGGGEA